MSIYATLWHLQFPRHGDAHVGCEWVEVLAQGVPAHIGTPTPSHGYESGDPYEAFLPPALRIESGASKDDLRAVVFVGAPRRSRRYPQRYRAGARRRGSADLCGSPAGSAAPIPVHCGDAKQDHRNPGAHNKGW